MTNFVKPGRVLSLTAPATVASGAGMLVGHIFAVACAAAASGAAVEGAVEGVFDLPNDTSTFSQGDYVYWDNTAKLVTSTSSGNTKIGVAEASASASSTVRVRLHGVY